ncbi:primase-helicase zinc-binding domain-containing protein [Streptomyces sp. 6N223]
MECPSCGSSNGHRLNNGNWVCDDCGAVTAG